MHLILKLVLSLILFHSIALALDFGQPCIPGTDDCDFAQFLICKRNESGPNFFCQCNDLVSIVDPSDSTNCVPYSTNLGEPCERRPDLNVCQKIPGAICTGFPSICRCNSTSHVEDGGACHPFAQRLSDSCNVTAQCSLFGEASCVENICQCQQATHFPNPEQTLCLKYAVELGEDCSLEEQCQNLSESDCLSGQCLCNSLSHVPDARNLTCLTYTDAIGGPCSVSGQCGNLEGTHCFGGACVCIPESHFPHENACLKYATQLSDLCTVPQQCDNLPNSSCLGGRCECDPFTQLPHNNTACLSYATALSDPCLLTDQCSRLQEAICLTGSCACAPQTHFPFSTDTCLRYTLALGNTCYPGTPQCDRLGPGVICEPLANPTCQCDSNHVPHPVQALPNKCLSLQPLLGGDCVPFSAQCAIQGSICDVGSSSCLCNPDGYVTSQNFCLAYPPGMNGSCVAQTVPEHCSIFPNATCLNGRCGCLPTMGWWLDACYTRVPFNSICHRDEECALGSGPNALCLLSPEEGAAYKTCQCRLGSEWRPDLGRCEVDQVSPIFIGDPCTTAEDCRMGIVGPVLCNDGRCTCALGTRPSFNMTTCRGSEVVGSVAISFMGMLALVGSYWGFVI